MTSIFSGLLYCADCGAKLSLATANGYAHFRCSMYKRTSRAKECTQHYIREDALKQLVLKQLQHFLSYLQQFERVFIRQQIDATLAERRYELSAKQKQIEKDIPVNNGGMGVLDIRPPVLCGGDAFPALKA